MSPVCPAVNMIVDRGGIGMPKLVAVRPLPNYRLWIQYDDGAVGEVDLTDLAGRGVFSVWSEPGVFENVSIDEFGAVAWGENLDLCPDALYLSLQPRALGMVTEWATLHQAELREL